MTDDGIEKELLETLAENYFKAAKATKQWESYRDSQRDRILVLMGYVVDEKKPQTKAVPGIIEVEVIRRTYVNHSYLKRRHPDVYDDCKRTSYQKYLREPK